MPNDPEAVKSLLQRWIARRVAPEAMAWFEERLRLHREETPERDLHITLGLIPRRLGKADLALGPDELTAAEAARSGWTPKAWSVDAAARTLTLLAAPPPSEGFTHRFKQLRRTADAAETLALYQGLPLYPDPQALEWEAGEGLRSNMKSVFEAIAHDNPYPREVFEEHRWNHMILKALFIGSRLAPIQGLDARANAELARIMRDFAHERWAAGRAVPFEIWRIVGPFAQDAEAVADLTRAFEAQGAGATAIDRKAAALGLAASAWRLADPALAADPILAADIKSGALTWETLSQEADALAQSLPREPVLPNAAPSGV
ncbi:MAG: EboA domain-containing protein [Rhodobacteraceae bacterium]|nr:EboA domain-containing protein [Paracoccaceae bacterium]